MVAVDLEVKFVAAEQVGDSSIERLGRREWVASKVPQLAQFFLNMIDCILM